ncbi:MAG TPA: putative toxin-antitoxin system toxin component, PIN family [Thiobacillaceae bacterium]|nr:putative toxin-antitoxin system toxin component, PIN family [Thiobacillaceae bacterium]
MNKPALVLDTNVALDLLLFDDPATRALRDALEAGRVRCMVSGAMLEEWRRVLGYPRFALESARQAELFDAYRALAERTEAVARGDLPRCADPDDQKFLELAAATGARGLVSKDGALLKLRRRCAARFRIMTPGETTAWLAS